MKLIFILIFFLLFSGCTSPSQKSQDSQVNNQQLTEFEKERAEFIKDSQNIDARFCNEFLNSLQSTKVNPYDSYKQYAIIRVTDFLPIKEKWLAILYKLKNSSKFSQAPASQQAELLDDIKKVNTNISDLKDAIVRLKRNDIIDDDPEPENNKGYIDGYPPNTPANQREFMTFIYYVFGNEEWLTSCPSETKAEIQNKLYDYYNKLEEKIYNKRVADDVVAMAIATQNKEIFNNIKQQLTKSRSKLVVDNLATKPLEIFSTTTNLRPKIGTIYKYSPKKNQEGELTNGLKVSVTSANMDIIVVNMDDFFVTTKTSYIDGDFLEYGYYVYTGRTTNKIKGDFVGISIPKTLHSFVELPKPTIKIKEIDTKAILTKDLYWYQPPNPEENTEEDTTDTSSENAE